MKTVFAMFCFLSILVGAVGERPNCTPMERDKWIRSALNEMQTIKVGMTRKDFMKVFTVTGGFFRSTRLKGTYAYKGSSYIMVDVEFAPAMVSCS